MGYREDRARAEALMPAMREILLPAATDYEDQHEATDIIDVISGHRIAVRSRGAEYAERYPYEFTIRASRPNGQKTELAKILEGYGDLMFYFFADEQAKTIIRWHLIDLHVFRRLATPTKNEPAEINVLSNYIKDKGGIKFLPVSLVEHPQLVIRSSHTIPKFLDWKDVAWAA